MSLPSKILEAPPCNFEWALTSKVSRDVKNSRFLYGYGMLSASTAAKMNNTVMVRSLAMTSSVYVCRYLDSSTTKDYTRYITNFRTHYTVQVQLDRYSDECDFIDT